MTNTGAARRPSPDHPAYRPDIDGLRAVAVLAVIGFHAFPEKVRGGFVGVDIFFVISGFLISSILLKGLQAGTFSFTDFYARRIRRIFPALAVLLAAVLVFGWLALTPQEYTRLGKHSLASAAFVANFTLWGESGYFDGAAETKPLLHLWSLGIEEQFYIVWPFVLWLCARLRLALLVPMALIGIASFAANVWTVQHSTLDAFYFPHTRFWELMLGSTLAYFAMRSATPSRSSATANVIAISGMTCIALALAFVTKASTFPGWWAVLPTGGAALLIAAGSESWLNRAILASPPMVWIGLISYPLYLWHWPMLSYARILVNPEGSAAIDPSRTIRISLVVLSFVLASATYRWIEQPIRRGVRPRALALPLVGAMVLVAVLAAATSITAGFPDRIGSGRAQYPVASKMVVDDYQALPLYKDIFNGVTSQPGRDILLTQPPSATHFDIALLGDSHAWVLHDALAQSTTHSIAAVGRGSCPPFFDVDGWRRDPGVETPLACQPLVNQALQHFLTAPETSTIVIAAYFNNYRHNIRLARTPRSNIDVTEAVRQTLLTLADSGKLIVLIYDVPEIPSSCYRPAFPVWRERTTAECTVSKQSYEEQRRDLVDVAREVASHRANVRVYDPAGVLCVEDRCGEIDADHYLYNNDGNHLNTFGARKVGQDLARFVERQLATASAASR